MSALSVCKTKSVDKVLRQYVTILNFQTDGDGETVWTQMRLLLKEPSDLLDALLYAKTTFEPPHDKTNKMTVCPAKTLISLGIGPV